MSRFFLDLDRHGGQRAVDKQKRLKEGGQDPRIKGIRA